jgi:hypothetical protein
MRLDAARMTETLCRRYAPVANPSRYEVCLLFRFKEQKLFHPENFFPRFLIWRMPLAPDGDIARNPDADRARIASGQKKPKYNQSELRIEAVG